MKVAATENQLTKRIQELHLLRQTYGDETLLSAIFLSLTNPGWSIEIKDERGEVIADLSTRKHDNQEGE